MLFRSAKHFPGVPVIPTMSTGATDALYLRGIPVYGVPSVWGDPDGNGTHGLNERVEAKALYTARDYLFDLIKAIAGLVKTRGFPKSVCPELVEGPFFAWCDSAQPQEQGRCFDRLSTSGLGLMWCIKTQKAGSGVCPATGLRRNRAPLRRAWRRTAYR